MEQNSNPNDILSLDTAWDRLIHRPPARVIAHLLAKTPITPNQVTLITLVPAVLSAIFFVLPGWNNGLLALFCFYLWAMLDHVDGDLARLTNRASEFGQRLDDTCDNIASLVILVAIFFDVVDDVAEQFRPLIAVIFLVGLVLNVVSGILVLEAKRKAREEAIKNNKVTPEFILFQRILDHLTGRDTFYLLVVSEIVIEIFGENVAAFWQLVSVSILIGGVYFISIIAFAAWFKMREKPALVS